MKQAAFAFAVLLAASFLGSVCRAADGPHVPEAVIKALAEKYKITDPTNWVIDEEDGKKIYATRWKDNEGTMHEADFDSAGNVVKTARGVKSQELPKTVLEAIEKKYAGAKITEATFFEGKATEYEVKVTDADGKKLLLVVSPDGSKITVFNF